MKIRKLLVLGRNDRLTNIVRTQKIHLQDAPPTAIQPETTGPRAGPAKGDTANRSIAFPRVLASHMSPTTALDDNNQGRECFYALKLHTHYLSKEQQQRRPLRIGKLKWKRCFWIGRSQFGIPITIQATIRCDVR